MAVTEASKETIWLCHLYNEILGLTELEIDASVQKIVIDNNSSIDLVKNPKHHDHTKTIDIRHHFISEVVETKLIKLDHISSQENPADLLTKLLSSTLHDKHMESLGLKVLCVKSLESCHHSDI